MIRTGKVPELLSGKTVARAYFFQQCQIKVEHAIKDADASPVDIARETNSMLNI